MTSRTDTPRPRSQDLQARSRRTRDRLVTAALEQFAARGFDDVTVDEICAAAGVAKGTCYFHFPTKEDLLVAAFHRGGPDVRAHADELVASGVPFAEAVLALGDRIARNTGRLPKPLVQRATIAALAAIGTGDPEGERRHRREAMLALVVAAQSAGEVRDRLRPAEVVMTLNWAILQGILVWSASEGPRPALHSVVRRRLLLALHGVAAPD